VVAAGAVWGADVSVVVSGVRVGVAGALDAGRAGQGLSVSGKVARPADSGVLGKNRGPFWPQALNIAALPTRACAVTRIFNTFNMQRL
jgi:hypothetical protein